MKVEQIERLEAILRVLEKCKLDNLAIIDVLDFAEKIKLYARTVKELRDEVNEVVKESKDNFISSVETVKE